MKFRNEAEFEECIINELISLGWEYSENLKNATEEDLLENWLNTLFEINKNELNNFKFNNNEITQITNKINSLKTPINVNTFLNEQMFYIKRDNKNDVQKYGKQVSLKLFNNEQPKFQIVQQPIFKNKFISKNRRGDILLLINGLPLIHMELKCDNKIDEAINQIAKYHYEKIFTEFLSLVQIFVTTDFNECKYFANQKSFDNFNKNFCFTWSDINNNLINNWQEFISSFLRPNTIEEIIKNFTIADKSDDSLKVMRSYQIYATKAIIDKVKNAKWIGNNSEWGYIWHATGSGKTMTSYKTAELISKFDYVDKVIFLIDRIELGIQSFENYNCFTNDFIEVTDTKNTNDLIKKISSNRSEHKLIITSIQKMNQVLKKEIIDSISKRRIVFIVDECHRSTFGEMFAKAREVFKNALFFGFTGTPIQDANKKKDNTTSSIFGNKLHEYTIYHGIRDKNILKFSYTDISTINDNDLRISVALEKAKAKDIDDVYSDERKTKIFEQYQNQYDMIEIEENIPESQYGREHKEEVVKNIVNNWKIRSKNRMFHAIFATTKITDAIEYYELFKKYNSEMNVTTIFEPSIDGNDENVTTKEQAVTTIIDDYNKTFDKNFNIAKYKDFKKDVCDRLSHKNGYSFIENDNNNKIDLVIVVEQLLTGFDSKWINALYLDKEIKQENIIQAFARTNRIGDSRKDYGYIYYFRKVNTMTKNIEEAFDLYCHDKNIIFTKKIEDRIPEINNLFNEIKILFAKENISNFEVLPNDEETIEEFIKLFNNLYKQMDCAKVQGLTFENTNNSIELKFDEKTFNTLIQRYQEVNKQIKEHKEKFDIPPYNIDINIVEHKANIIDQKWMDEKFGKNTINIKYQEIEQTLEHLDYEDQKIAKEILDKYKSNEINFDLKTEIKVYKENKFNEKISRISNMFGIDKSYLKRLFNLKEININEEWNYLLDFIDIEKAKQYFETNENIKLDRFEIEERLNEVLVKEFGKE